MVMEYVCFVCSLAFLDSPIFFAPRHLIRSFRFLLFSTERYLMGLDLVNFVDANVVVGASLWANGVGCIYYLA